MAVGLSIALAFSNLVATFSSSVITPLVRAAGGGGETGLGFTVRGQLVDLNSLMAAIVYFIVFVAVVYFAIVVPYRSYQRKRGVAVFTLSHWNEIVKLGAPADAVPIATVRR